MHIADWNCQGVRMNIKQIINKVSGGVFALSLLMGIAAMSGTTAQAQYPNGQDRRDDRDRERERNREERERRDRDNGRYNNGYGNPLTIAQQQGRRDGYVQGDSDGQYGRPYNARGGRTYKNGTSGYNSSYGNKGDYRRAYQDAFVSGYDEGYQRYNRGNRRRNDRRYP